VTDRRLVLTDARVLLPDGVADGLAIVVDDGLIVALEPAAAVPPGGRTVRLGGATVVPGLIDLHAHGAAGRSFDEPDPAAHRQILRFHARHGVTAMQASLVSATVADLERRLDALAITAAQGDDGAALLGVHLEGPFLSAAQCGAHDPAVLRAPEPADADLLLRHRDLVTMVTVAPELPGVCDLVRRLSGAGIVVAAGHSEASGAELARAVDAGLRHLTHLWSGQSGLTRRGPWRVPGLLEESLASDGLSAELIADGRHLPAPLLEIARRCLPDRIVLVSDATAGTGMPAGFRYTLGTVSCEVADGVGRVVGADAFGGSVTPLSGMVAHLHRELGWPLPEVIAAASTRPAQVLGLGDRKGRIAVGYDADLAVLDDDLRVRGTLVGGVWAHQADED
jgi:N-acetylglucosamine-6-phosphate deacetylase